MAFCLEPREKRVQEFVHVKHPSKAEGGGQVGSAWLILVLMVPH